MASVLLGTEKTRGGLIMLKHVIWMDGNGEGRLAIREEKDIVVIKKLAGSNLSASHLFAVLDAAIPGWQEKAEALHLGRKNAWLVKVRRGRWGSTTFLLKIIRDIEQLDIPVVASLHVSCAGKLPSKIELWLGDLAPLAAALKREFPQTAIPSEEEEDSFFPFWCVAPDGSYFKIRVVEPQFIGLDQGVMLPGEPSGLLDPDKEHPEVEAEESKHPEVEVI